MSQTYEPYRSSLLSKEQLSELFALRPNRVMLNTLSNWLIILLAWSAVSLWPTWWLTILMIPVIGTRFYALLIIAHDGLHRRLFESRRINDLWNDIFILGTIGTITRLNRVNHMEHHRQLATKEDPDRYKYISSNKHDYFSFCLFLTGLLYLGRALKNVFSPNIKTSINTGKTVQRMERYQFRDIIILFAWQVSLIGGLSYYIGWWAYPVLWLMPVYIFGFVADMVRVFAEHSRPILDDVADESIRLITYQSNILEKQFFAPNNMNYHAAHHLWPAIPYYNLPEADSLMRKSAACNEGLELRNSYLGYLLSYWRNIPRLSKIYTNKET